MTTTLSPEILAQRRKGIGGSDVAGILGISPWTTPLDVYLDKIGEADPLEMTAPMRWGLLLEDEIAQEYSRQTGRKVRRVNRILQHPEHPFMLASLDRTVVADGGVKRILEVKTVGKWSKQDEWGPDGTDEIPEHYLCQTSHYLAVTGAEIADVAVLIAGQDFRIYEVRRNQKLIELLIREEGRFWNDHVESRTPPECQSLEDVKRRWPLCTGGSVRLTDDQVQHLIQRESLKANIRQLQAELKELESGCRRVFEHHENVIYDGKVFATLKHQTRRTMDHKALLEEHPNLAEEFQKETTYRVLRTTKALKEAMK